MGAAPMTEQRFCDDCGLLVADPGSRPTDEWAEKFCFARQYAHERAECLQRKINRLEATPLGDAPWFDPGESAPIHLWFGLSYSSYLVLHRVALESMPVEWQRRFLAVLGELHTTLQTDELPTSFTVQVRDPVTKRFERDPWAQYRHQRVPRREQKTKGAIDS